MKIKININGVINKYKNKIKNIIKNIIFIFNMIYIELI